jgi:hypothetical protein
VVFKPGAFVLRYRVVCWFFCFAFTHRRIIRMADCTV